MSPILDRSYCQQQVEDAEASLDVYAWIRAMRILFAKHPESKPDKIVVRPILFGKLKQLAKDNAGSLGSDVSEYDGGVMFRRVMVESSK